MDELDVKWRLFDALYDLKFLMRAVIDRDIAVGDVDNIGHHRATLEHRLGLSPLRHNPTGEHCEVGGHRGKKLRYGIRVQTLSLHGTVQGSARRRL